MPTEIKDKQVFDTVKGVRVTKELKIRYRVSKDSVLIIDPNEVDMFYFSEKNKGVMKVGDESYKLSSNFVVSHLLKEIKPLIFFIRVHGKYIININKALMEERDFIMLEKDIKVPIGLRWRNEGDLRLRRIVYNLNKPLAKNEQLIAKLLEGRLLINKERVNIVQILKQIDEFNRQNKPDS